MTRAACGRAVDREHHQRGSTSVTIPGEQVQTRRRGEVSGRGGAELVRSTGRWGGKLKYHKPDSGGSFSWLALGPGKARGTEANTEVCVGDQTA
jgi:hypothetical protein